MWWSNRSCGRRVCVDGRTLIAICSWDSVLTHELVHIFGSELCHKHVLSQVVIFTVGVRSKGDIHVVPCALSGVGMQATCFIDTTKDMVNGFMIVTMFIQTMVGFRAVT